ncbi:MAG: DUF4143 domain-containing protein [Bacteroidetes bacterium]|nr:DUF4143 domain-containing protein [Bacteroidota bacterium]
MHSLLGLRTQADVEGHPKSGASWEVFVLSQVVRHIGAHPDECFFWATHAGAELDLLVVRGRRRIGFEAKRTSSPSVTPSMRSALTDLKLDRIYVIHAGDRTFPLQRRIEAISITRLLTDVDKL